MTKEEIIYGEEICQHCGGIGCVYCDKKGKVLVRQPAKKCRHLGAAENHQDVSCSRKISD